MLGDISAPEATHLRLLEVRARVLRDHANALRTAVKSDQAFDEAQALFHRAIEVLCSFEEKRRKKKRKKKKRRRSGRRS